MHELYNNCFNSAFQNEIMWRVAIYVRLSREDDNDKEQSESIENQINFLKATVTNQGWTIVDIYKDDGYTGTNFERPEFQRMLGDIELGKINLVITKDLSRLGRDYIETGRYVEKYFPSMNVRYIAVTDNIDTFDPKKRNNDMTHFKSFINYMYAKFISKKVRTAIITKATQGDCIKAFLPYGYKKDPNDKNNILIDEEVAGTVKLIFDLYKSGKSKKEITQYLNDLGVKTPLKYKQDTTNYYNPNKNDTYQWNNTIVNKILRDRIYVGDLVQLKDTKVNYKVKKRVKIPSEEQVVVQNHHPAIVDRATFETVQEMLIRQTNEWKYSDRKRHLLAGLVFCKCGSRITYSLNHGKFSKCLCSSYKKYGKKFCTNVHLKEEELLQLVSESLKENISKYLDMDELKYDKILSKNETDDKKEMIYWNKKKESIDKIIAGLYEDKISGVIGIDTFKNLIRKYEDEKKECIAKLNLLEDKKNNIASKPTTDEKQIKDIAKKLLTFDEINEENKSLVFKLIDKIVIDDKNISIKYKFELPT